MNLVPSNKLSRGKFIRLSSRIALSLAGLLGLGGLVRFFSYAPEPEPAGIVDLGPEADFPESGKLVRLDIPAVIYRTDTGFSAYSLICTHLGCTLEESGEGFSCPCHGSEFSPEGAVLKGPAGEDLPSLKVEVSEKGILLVRRAGGGK